MAEKWVKSKGNWISKKIKNYSPPINKVGVEVHMMLLLQYNSTVYNI